MANFFPMLWYALLTLRHKWFVFRAGLWTKAPLWRLVVHDASKFAPSELPHYARQFYGAKNDPEGFARAWLHHQNVNPHHWEYWISRTGHYATPAHNGALPMPEWAVREMVADWFGASRAYEGRWPGVADWPWFEKNWEKISVRLHPDTAHLVIEVHNQAMARMIQWNNSRNFLSMCRRPTSASSKAGAPSPRATSMPRSP